MQSRRAFLKGTALSMFGVGSAPLWLGRAAQGTGGSASRGKVLVALFQRGAADGLNTVVPFGEKDYYKLRPNLAIPAPSRGAASGDAAIDLDGFFGLHPGLANLKPMWDAKELAIVNAVGSPDPTRSHFDAQDYMEAGTPGVKSTRDGWLNRAMVDADGHPVSPVRAVAMGPALPRILRGAEPAVAIDRLEDFQVRGRQAEGAFSSIYGDSADTLLRHTGKEAFDAIRIVRQVSAQTSHPGADYPNGPFARNLRQIAALIKADVGLEVAFADVGGWDHHVNEVGPRPATGQLANLLRQVGDSLSAFRKDLGDRFEEVVLVTMSEFGRTARENGTRGTDHGHANLMFVMGGAIAGGKVYGEWPGLSDGQLYERRDLAVTTDFRDVLGELVSQHLQNQDRTGLFPGYTLSPQRFRHLYRVDGTAARPRA
ncbi:MAG: DUF1501 domain-containing protein [Bryobacterales bacterium]|nr:DUF1501 domain-containing protein [Bryobacterales bacterium]